VDANCQIPHDSEPEARFLASDRTSTLDDYPNECPRCRHRLPLTRGVYQLKLTPWANVMLVCGAAIALVSLCTLLPLLIFFASGAPWVPGWSMVKKAINMQREYAVTCGNCGFSFRVRGPRYG